MYLYILSEVLKHVEKRRSKAIPASPAANPDYFWRQIACQEGISVRIIGVLGWAEG